MHMNYYRMITTDHNHIPSVVYRKMRKNYELPMMYEGFDQIDSITNKIQDVNEMYYRFMYPTI
jgi:hypothetical protein